MKAARQSGPSFGLYVPNFGERSTPPTFVTLAQAAEDAGWDGFFLWDHLVEWNKPIPLGDSLTTLAAIAVSTKRIQIGTTVSPLPKYKPWTLARQVATIDQLSNGRMTLGVGLGVTESTDYARFGEVPDSHTLAEKLDETLEIVVGLWAGKPYSFKGKHFSVGESVFLPTPVQKPRIPIWVGGFWPHRAPFRRAALWDGVVPLVAPGRPPKPEDLTAVVNFIRTRRDDMTGFEVVNIGWTRGTDPKKDRDRLSAYAEAGMTWWLESLYTKRNSPEDMLERIKLGPPKWRSHQGAA